MQSIPDNPVEKALAQSLLPLCTGICIVQPTLRVAIALSGGLDSMVLLQALSAYADVLARTRSWVLQLHAFHIHHGLSASADEWLLFCQRQAQTRQFAFVGERVQLHNLASAGVEAAARQARYDALARLCEQHQIHILLTAHHQDDQAETILLQLLRGAGAAGLASMPSQNEFSKEKTILSRPFLSLSRQQLQTYADHAQLVHIEDHSNNDQRYARNALRHEIMPRLAQIRPGYRAGLARSAELLAEASGLLDDLACLDLAHIQNEFLVADKVSLQIKTPSLPCRGLRCLELPRARNVLRYWIRSFGLYPPSRARLDEMLKQLLKPNPNSRATCGHAGREFVLWREQFYLVPITLVPDVAIPAICWQGQSEIEISAWGGVLHFSDKAPVDGPYAMIVRSRIFGKKLSIYARAGGERFRRYRNAPSCSLQHAYQQRDIPPWLRNGPLIFLDEELLFVGHLGQHYEPCEAILDEECIYLSWEIRPLHKVIQRSE